MIIVDANIILRYLLEDIPELFEKSSDILEKQDIFIPNEIVAEVVYVLEKVYQVDRKDIQNAWKQLFTYTNLTFTNKQVISIALAQYTEIKIDFVDALLVGYFKVEHWKIETFDKKLKKRLRK